MACGGGGGGGDDGGTEPPNYSIVISISPTIVSLPPGDSVTVTVNIQRGGGYTGAITLSTTGLPGDVACIWSSYTLSGSETSATMKLVVSEETPLGTYPVAVHAAGGGISEASTPLGFTVTAPPGFTLTLGTAALTVPQNDSGHVLVNIGRASGFAGAVNFALEDAPAGVSGTFIPAATTGASTDLKLVVSANAVPGAYTLKVHGTANGAPERTKTFILTVRSSTASGFTISMNPPSLSIGAGTTGTATVLIQRTGGFAGPVSIFIEGYPSGTSTSFNPQGTTTNSSTLTMTVAATVAAGTYPLTIRGQATGLPDATVAFQLVVTVVPGFTLRGPSAPLTIVAGGTPQTFNLGIDRTGGFTDPVTLSMTGFPAGMTTSINPAVASGNSAVVTITVAAGVPAAGYVGTLHATATGLAERTTSVAVTVVAGGTSIVWRFCAPYSAPVFFAFQDGTSPFSVVTPAGDGTFTATIGSGKGAVVMVYPGLPSTGTTERVRGAMRTRSLPRFFPSRLSAMQGSVATGYTTYVRMATTSELQDMAQAQCPASVARKSINGSVANVSAQQAYAAGMGGAFTIGLPGTSSNFVLDQVLDGPRDLIAGRANIVGEAVTPDRIIVRRDINPPNGSTLPVLDFSSSEAFSPASATLTLNAIPNGYDAEALSGISTANQTFTLVGSTGFSAGPTYSIFGLPTAQLRTSDLHLFSASAEAPNPPKEQTIDWYTHDVTSQTLSFVPELPMPSVGPYTPATVTRMRAAGSIGSAGSEFGEYVEVSFVQSSRAWVMSQTRGWIGATSNFDIRTLVLSGFSGWNENDFGVKSGIDVAWTVELRSAGVDFVPKSGSLLRTLAFHGTVVP